jgi:hypothetical protein
MSNFNLMVILGELQQSHSIETSYNEFYQSILKLPYLGSSIPTLLPSLILFFSFIFALLSIFKLKNRALSAFKQVSSTTEELRLSNKAKQSAD